MRKFAPKPICGKCGTEFKLSDWGPRQREEGTPFAHYHVEFQAEDPREVAENGDITNEGKPEHLIVACPVCDHTFEMQTAEQFQAGEGNVADLYVPPEPTESD